uniref:Endoribonuclease n=1 Tax=Parastrongyloides trichosuri TaxID=131310 RepID=A0A0N4Z7P3_PARTI
MREIDFDKPSQDDLVISWGKTIDKYGKEEQQEPLFKYVNESLFEKPVYKVLIEIYNNSVFKTPVCTKDVAIEGKKKELIDNFINVYTGMPVFKLGYNFLVENNLIKDDYNAFIDELYHFWFGMYSRCHRTHTQGSSGWEHVFSGEWKEDIIDGHHNWIRYYLLQKEGRIKYHGHTKVKGNVTGDIQYTWDGYLKEVGGFFMNTSPIFDFTVFTICSLPQYGNSDCNIKVDGYDIKIVSFHQKCDDGICLSTCYPS